MQGMQPAAHAEHPGIQRFALRHGRKFGFQNLKDELRQGFAGRVVEAQMEIQGTGCRAQDVSADIRPQS